ncbi:hypothetical protein B0H10DRAFT_2446058 [Mycena sp. CBHHK59/15]|nr:hypothetical protein B0H10DRAFT_2446058 [Mycena sp. CBHHK59/15]
MPPTPEALALSDALAAAAAVAQFAPVPLWAPILAIFATLAEAWQDDMDWETVQDSIGSLNSEATIATFLAAVQSQIIAISYQDNSTRVKVATNMLGFAGVILDVIAACFALLASTILQRHTRIIEKEFGAIHEAPLERLARMASLLATLPHSVVPRDLRGRVYDRLQALTQLQGDHAGQSETSPQTSSRNFRSVATSFRAIQSVGYIANTSMTALLCGILCFFASVLCLAISTQPRIIWIVSVVICLSVSLLPLFSQAWKWVRITIFE